MMNTPKSNWSNGFLTAPDGLPNRSRFCKYLITRNVDGLTGFFAVFSGIIGIWLQSGVPR